jgi:hypothetical protein
VLRIKEIERLKVRRLEGWEKLRSWKNAVGDTRVFLCTSAEVIERKGDGHGFCAKTMCTGSVKVYEQVGRFEELGMERGEVGRTAGRRGIKERRL